MKTSEHYKMCIPGPIEIEEDVLNMMAEPMMPHFGQEWADIYKETITLAKKVFFTNEEVYIFPGSGSAALDMGIGNLVFPNKSVLVLANGFFGSRLSEIAKGFTPDVDCLDFGFAQPIDLNKVREALNKKKYEALLVVQVETSIGILNPVKKLAEMTRDTDTVLFVDGVSSIGVERMMMDEWGVDVCATASQKGLESPPGLALLAFNKKAWKLMETVNRPDWYLNLKVWKRYEEFWGPLHPQLVTHAIPLVRAMTLALQKMQQEGFEVRLDRYESSTEYFREKVKTLGLELYIEKDYAHGLTSIRIPDGKAVELMDFIKKTHHVLIGGGLGPSKGKAVRIGHMGILHELHEMDSMIEILADAKKNLGI